MDAGTDGLRGRQLPGSDYIERSDLKRQVNVSAEKSRAALAGVSRGEKPGENLTAREFASRELGAAAWAAQEFARERDEARAERDNLSVEAHHWMGEAVRYREALKRIAAFHHAPGKTYKAAWVESVRIAREALGGGDD